MTTTQYLDPALLRINLGISETIKPDKVNEIVTESNQEIDMQLKPFAESLPLKPDTAFFGQARKCAVHYARALWFNAILEHEVEEYERKRYESKLEALKSSFRAERTTRTKATVVYNQPRDYKIYAPVGLRETAWDIF